MIKKHDPLKKRKLSKKDMQFEPTPVWVEVDGVITPTPFFLNWWQRVAELRFGDGSKWLEAAIELGYVVRYFDPNVGKTCLDPTGFEYDADLYRASLNIPADMPLVSQNEGHDEDYRRLWQRLLSEEEVVNDGE